MKKFLRYFSITVFVFSVFLSVQLISGCSEEKEKQPNILFAIADDWSWPHASIAGAKEITTTAFDRIATEGVLFTNAYCSAPSCTPSRGAVLTGQYHWRLEEGGNLWSTLQKKFVSYPGILEKNGYYTGYTGKGWAPGMIQKGGRKQNPAGKAFNDLRMETPGYISNIDYAGNFKAFLESRPANQPFCFWYGGYEPHRPYDFGIGLRSGKNPADVMVPSYLPDADTVRQDILDYYFEVEWFDRQLEKMITLLEKAGELENTIIVCTSDNGMPFPRAKSNLYDFGTRMPLAVSWANKIKGGREVTDFVSLIDMAPTFLEAAGIEIPDQMTGKSLLHILLSDKTGPIEASRDHVLVGKERHAWVRQGGLGYHTRAIRTKDFLYIINFKPDRWPAGDPLSDKINDPDRPYGDIDACPTKQFMMDRSTDPAVSYLFKLAFLKRPPEELYDLTGDPGQLNNVAGIAKYKKIKEKLRNQLVTELEETDDPRIFGKGDIFDKYPYYNGDNFRPAMYYDSLAIYSLKATEATDITGTSVKLQARLTKLNRSEERRVGKGCRSRWSPYH